MTIARALEAPDGLHVTFAPDGHEAVFTRTWLAGYATSAVDGRCEDAKRLWSARDFPSGPPVTSWAEYAGSDAARLSCLRQVLSRGFMVLAGVPAEPGAAARVVASFGYIRRTSRGQLFDLPARPGPARLAYQGLPPAPHGGQLALQGSGLATPHTDAPYRDPAPGVLVLHCLATAAGESGLLDGFRAAAQLRAEDPAAFEVLSQTPVTFGYSDAGAQLRTSQPMIGLNAAGLIREVRYDSRAMEPMRPRSGASAARAAEEMREFYAAYRGFAAILLRASLRLRLALSPGDCVVTDNTRILHSPGALAADGTTAHLQGCYAGLDEVESTVAALARSSRKAPASARL